MNENMPLIQIERKLLEVLVNFKLEYINNEINSILKKWNYESSEKFLNGSKSGKIQEAEMDAISMRQLFNEKDKLVKMIVNL